MTYRDPSLALQDGVYVALAGLAGGSVFYDVPDDAVLPYIYFGDDDLIAALDAGDFTDATANIEVYAADKLALKTLVGQVVTALNRPIALNGFSIIEYAVSSVAYRTMNDGMTQQASIEVDYLIQPAD